MVLYIFCTKIILLRVPSLLDMKLKLTTITDTQMTVQLKLRQPASFTLCTFTTKRWFTVHAHLTSTFHCKDKSMSLSSGKDGELSYSHASRCSSLEAPCSNAFVHGERNVQSCFPPPASNDSMAFTSAMSALLYENMWLESGSIQQTRLKVTCWVPWMEQ